MAEEKKTFPMLPVGAWWELRKKFTQSIPGVVTDNYLATVLEMKIDSARNNVLGPLKQLRIIDEEGRTQDRARQWRADALYPQVCKEILKEVYPSDLLDAVPNPSQQRSQAESWFANHTGLGESAAKRMVAMYTVLAEADPAKAPERDKKERPVRGPGEKMRRPRPIASRVIPSAMAPSANASAGPRQPDGQGQHRPQLSVPGININLQVHISADATPDQIDQIFASMAKHIYQRA